MIAWLSGPSFVFFCSFVCLFVCSLVRSLPASSKVLFFELLAKVLFFYKIELLAKVLKNRTFHNTRVNKPKVLCFLQKFCFINDILIF